LALGISSLFVEAKGVAWILWFAALLDACGFLYFYGWYYRIGRFDLMNIPRT
jgi:hypothetical protein